MKIQIYKWDPCCKWSFATLPILYSISFNLTGLWSLHAHCNWEYLLILTLLSLLTLFLLNWNYTWSHFIKFYLNRFVTSTFCTLYQFVPCISFPYFSLPVQSSLTNTLDVYLFDSQQFHSILHTSAETTIYLRLPYLNWSFPTKNQFK